jgi:6-phosphogluconolactonase (cycloisomerase 2 family)
MASSLCLRTAFALGRTLLLALVGSWLVAACGSVGVGNTGTQTFGIGGTVTGLSGTGLVLQDNGGENLAVDTNGSFSFPAVKNGSAYAITVLTQPSGPAQICTVTSGSGTVESADVTTVGVDCTTTAYTIGGSVGGLLGSGLILQDNGGDNIVVSSNGDFTFPTPVASGKDYAVTVLSQPVGPAQTCSVLAGNGTVKSENVITVGITCTTNSYTVGGTVSGLPGSGLVLQDNGGDSLPLASNGSFTFATPLASGAHYTVTVAAQPAGETCAVMNGTGTIASANITNVAITCGAGAYTIGGSVSGLTGSGLVLQNNGGNNLPVSGTSFTFSTPVATGSPYAVTVLSQPTGQFCAVANGSGTVAVSNVTNVAVTCTTGSYTLGGTITGLSGAGLVLQNNGGSNLAVSGASFTFPVPIPTGTHYSVTVLSQPSNPTQACTVATGTGTGTMGTANVTSVVINCSTTTYAIGGNVSGLTGSGLVLQDNGGNNLAVTGNGTFVFTTKIASGAHYSVTVLTQPTLPAQTCAVADASGTVVAAPITNVSITCTANQGQFLYVASDTSNTILGFTIGSNGALTSMPAPFAGGDLYVYAVAVDPTAQYVYAINLNSNDISLYASDATTGLLTLQAATAATTGLGPTLIAIDPLGQFLYVTNGNAATVSAYTINAATGALTSVGPAYPVGNGPQSVAIDPIGQYLYVANQTDSTISAFAIGAGGVLTPINGGVAYPAAGSAPSSIAVDPSKQLLYVADNDGTLSIYAIDAANGELTATPSTGFVNAGARPGPFNATIDPTGSFLYVTDYTDDQVYGYTINADGSLNTTIGSPYATGTGPLFASMDPSGQFLYVSDNGDGTIAEFMIAADTGVGAGVLVHVPGSPYSGAYTFYGAGKSAIR